MVNKGKKVKITKEQYNRIFATKLISENFINEIKNDLTTECNDLIKYFYGKTEELSPFWGQHGLTYDEICDMLLEKKIIIPKDGHYEIPKKLGTPKNAKEILENKIQELIDSKDGMIDETDSVQNSEMNNAMVKTIASNREIQIVSDGTNTYVVYYKDLGDKPLSDDEVNEFMKDPTNIGYGFRDWDLSDYDKNDNNNGASTIPIKRVIEVDSELKDDLIMTYQYDDNIKQALDGNINEMTVAGGSGMGGSSGPFTGPLETKGPIKRELNTPDVPVVYETTTATPQTVGPYAANAFGDIDQKGSFKKHKKTRAEKETQYPKGSMVSFDSCTKLNNNKEAQNGGCSQGAVDNVTKTKQIGGSIISPSSK